MKLDFRILLTAIAYTLFAANLGIGDDGSDVRLPKGVKAVWELDKAYRETTPTRERICINGLWRWQPALDEPEQVPRGNWGYFKVPGCWPGITDYMQKDCQTVFTRIRAGRTSGWRASPRPGISARSPSPAIGPAAASFCRWST